MIFAVNLIFLSSCNNINRNQLGGVEECQLLCVSSSDYERKINSAWISIAEITIQLMIKIIF